MDGVVPRHSCDSKRCIRLHYILPNPLAQTALFASVEAQLFSLIDTTEGQTPTTLTQAFRVFSYLGLLSNLLATTSALFVLERVSGLSTRARKLSLLPNSLP